MVIIASHTAGGNLTVFLPRKHPRLCPRSLTTWMAAKLSSSYYNHLITEAPPCALPVFFFFFTSIFTGLLWDVLHNQQSYSHERMHWDNLLFKMMSSWQRQSRSGSNRRALDTKKNTTKNYCAPACTGVCFTSAFTKKDSLVFLFRSEASEKKLTFAVWAALLGEIANKQSWSQAVWFKNKHSGDARRGKAHGVYVRLEHTDETKKGVWGRDWTLNL